MIIVTYNNENFELTKTIIVNGYQIVNNGLHLELNECIRFFYPQDIKINNVQPTSVENAIELIEELN